MLSLAIVLCLGALASSAPQKVYYSLDEADNHFEDFMKTYNKEYKSEAEKLLRFEIFKDNLADINERNLRSESAVFGINEFADLTLEEFTRMYTGILPPGTEIPCPTAQSLYNASFTAPDSFDWRTQNKVTSVKSQGTCGSCWAFSTVGTTEGQYAIKYNQLIDLSPQQLVDCSTHNNGCGSGMMSRAIFDLVQSGGGFMSEQSYPYEMRQSTCRADASRAIVTVTGCRQFIVTSEEEVKQILTQVGPLSIVVATSTWHKYDGKILTECDQNLNHAVLLVGYGEEGGIPYWIIKNSWGPSWGDAGYIKMTRNQNMCNFLNGQIVTVAIQ